MEYRIRSLSLFQYSIATVALVLIMLGSFFLMGTDGSTLYSFLMESLCFLLLTVVATHLYLGNKKLVVYFTLAYVIKLLIGLLHYLIFIDPHYFSSLGNTQILHQEFQAVTEFLEFSVSEKERMGLFYLSLDGYVTHQELLSIIAIPLKFFGVRILNIAPINSFFSILAAVNVYIVSKRITWNPNTEKYILLLLAYFPATLITSYFFRDIVGWAFISIGIVLMCKANNMVTRIITMIVAMVLFYLQRNAYAVLPMALLVAQYGFLSKKKEEGLALLFLLAAIIALPNVIGLSFASSDEAMLAKSNEWPLYLLPIKIIVGLIGPFPWANFFLMMEKTPEVTYYLSDYIMGCLNIAIVLSLITKWKSFIQKEYLTGCTIVGIFLLIMGVMNKHMHMTYISIGVFFMLPWLIEIAGVKNFRICIKYSVFLLALLNITVMMLGLAGMGTILR